MSVKNVRGPRSVVVIGGHEGSPIPVAIGGQPVSISAPPVTSFIDENGNLLRVRHVQAMFVTAGNHGVVAAVFQRRLRVLKFKIAIQGNVNVYWIELNPVVRLSSTTYLAAQGGWTDDGLLPDGYWTAAVGKDLGVNLSANVNVGIDVWYAEVP